MWGVQTDVEYRLGTAWKFNGGYLYDHATVIEFNANPALIGNFLPQVPNHRGSMQVAYSNPRYATVAAGLQWVGRQFDDDQNVRKVPGEPEPGLPKYALLDLMASRAFGGRVEILAGVQNLFNQQYFVGTLPTTVGSPRFVSGGCDVGPPPIAGEPSPGSAGGVSHGQGFGWS